MTFISFAPGWRAGIAAPVFLLAGSVLAQAPDSQAPQSEGRKPRQPIAQSVQQQNDPQASADKIQAAADRRFRDMDRRLNRTLRTVCNGC
jgi:hypothetical protein